MWRTNEQTYDGSTHNLVSFQFISCDVSLLLEEEIAEKQLNELDYKLDWMMLLILSWNEEYFKDSITFAYLLVKRERG